MSDRLPFAWEFWGSNVGSAEYEIEPIVSVSTVGEFWNAFEQFPSVEDLRRGAFSLFKKGIRPAWEDPSNSGGQTIRFRAMTLTQESWEHLVLAVIGGTLESQMDGVPLCGISVVKRTSCHKVDLDVWCGRGVVDMEHFAQLFNVDASLIHLKPHCKH